MPRVSALVPTYNRAAHVEGAIRSVLAQTYDDLEVVVVDDGSTDETADVLASYRDHPQVVVRHNEENRGIAASFNRAARVADGELLCVLGDDDRWHPEKVHRQVTHIESLPDDYAAVYTGGVNTRATDGRVVGVYRPTRRGEIYPAILRSFGLGPHSSHMYRRECFEAVGGFDSSFAHGVDWELCIRLAKRYKFDYLPQPLVNRRLHDENVSKPVVARAELHRWITQKFADEYASHPEIARAVRSDHHRHAAHAAARRGDVATARSNAAAALRLSPSPWTAGLFCSLAAGRQGYEAAFAVATWLATLTGLLPGRSTRISPDEGVARRWWESLSPRGLRGRSTTPAHPTTR